jgi:hypothetical protein
MQTLTLPAKLVVIVLISSISLACNSPHACFVAKFFLSYCPQLPRFKAHIVHLQQTVVKVSSTSQFSKICDILAPQGWLLGTLVWSSRSTYYSPQARQPSTLWPPPSSLPQLRTHLLPLHKSFIYDVIPL